MKQTLILIAAMLTMAYGTMKAQTAQVKNAAKSVFTLTTFKADGSLLASSHGVFAGENGEAISDLKPFIGAAKAVVIDAKGTKMNVTRMIGINDLYDVARFRVDGKTIPAPIAAKAAKDGEQVWLVPYTLNAKQQPIGTTVKSVETFMDKYSYYIFNTKTPENTAACPFVNAAGELIGLMQPSTTSDDTHATDVRFIRSLETNGLASGDANLQKIGIPVAMPKDKTQAQIMLLMTGQGRDSLKYDAAIADFIALFPTLTDGYIAKAQLFTDNGKFSDAAKVMDEAVKNADDKADAHFNYAKLIYGKEMSDARTYNEWTLDKAMDEATQAYTMSPLPLYKHLQAQINFSKGEYQQAYDIFKELSNEKDFSSAEILYESARCKQMLGAPNDEIIALLDSAINTTDTLRINEAAPYFLMRGDIYNQMKKYRDAVFDYTRYEVLTRQRPSAQFYYIREQAEVNGRLYQQALGDISRAIILDPNEPVYIAEMASLQLRINQPDKALQAAEQCIKIAPEYSTGHLLYGLALIKTNRKTEGLEALKKAKEMGDEQAQTLIDKYSK